MLFQGYANIKQINLNSILSYFNLVKLKRYLIVHIY